MSYISDPFSPEMLGNEFPMPRNRRQTSRLASVLVTIAVHFLVVAVLITGLHMTRTFRVQKPIEVSILKQKRQEKRDDIAAPRMTAPAQITLAAPPEFVIENPPPPVIRAAVAASAPSKLSNPATAVTTTPGETRETYLGRILAQLNKYKRYPAAARATHVTGVVLLHFVMNEDGRIVSFNISKSSGHAVLDNEVVSLVERVQPLPPIPADFPTRTLDAEVPITFSLNMLP